MEGYIQTSIGILVSIILFLVGYKQTIGARQERIRTANKRLVEVIIKRIILEELVPTRKEIDRLKGGIAQDSRIPYYNMLNYEALHDILYLQLFENDLISKEQRLNYIDYLIKIPNEDDTSVTTDNKSIKSKIQQNQSEIKQESNVDFESMILGRERASNSKMINFVTVFLGLLSVVLGTSVSFFDDIVHDITIDSYMVVFSAIISIISIIIAYTYLRFKNKDINQDLAYNRINRGLEFEKFIARELTRNNIIFETTSLNRDAGCDFIANIKGNRTAIEVKYWSRPPNSRIINNIFFAMQETLERNQLNFGYILVNKSYNLPSPPNKDGQNIEFIAVDDFIKIIN